MKGQFLNIYTITVEHPKTAVNLTFWQKMKLLIGKDVILYIDTSFSVQNGHLTIHSKPTLLGPTTANRLPISEHDTGHR